MSDDASDDHGGSGDAEEALRTVRRSEMVPRPFGETKPASRQSSGGASEGTEGSVWSRLSLHEFLVDFFGGLVPGILFIGALSTSLLPGIAAVSLALHEGRLNAGDGVAFVQDAAAPWALVQAFLTAAQNTPNTIWIALFSLVLMASYVIGHLFYRRDPKIPDQRSFKRLRKKDRQCKTDDDARASFACADEKECQFPYQYMDRYLEHRGQHHLAAIARRWNDETRSKTYLNSIKLRLALRYPHQYRSIVRNEAHVRLITSTWYMAVALLVATTTMLLVLMVTALLYTYESGAHTWFVWGRHALEWSVDALVPTLLVIAASLYTCREVELFLHYQRLREVFTVLEVAYTVANPDQPLYATAERSSACCPSDSCATRFLEVPKDA